MKLQLLKTGGIAGIRNSYPILYATDLSLNELQKLNRLINHSNFYELPNEIKSGGYDFIYYTLIIQDNKKYHSVKADFMRITPELNKLKQLIDYIEHLYLTRNIKIRDDKIRDDKIKTN